MAAQRDRAYAVWAVKADGACGGFRGSRCVGACRLCASHWQASFVDHGAITTCCWQRDSGGAVTNVDGQLGGHAVGIAVSERVGKDIALAALRACVAHIAVGAVGRQCQHAVGAVDGGGAGGWNVDAGCAKLHLGDDCAVCSHRVSHGAHSRTRDDVATRRAAAHFNVPSIVVRYRYIVHNGDNNFARTGHTARARHTHNNGVSQCIAAITAGMRLSCRQRVFIADRAVLVASVRNKARDFYRAVWRIHGGQQRHIALELSQ